MAASPQLCQQLVVVDELQNLPHLFGPSQWLSPDRVLISYAKGLVNEPPLISFKLISREISDLKEQLRKRAIYTAVD